METYDKLHDIIADQVKKINAEKERIVKEKLKEYLGYELDIIKESQRAFPRLAIQYHPGHVEVYLWNDGSEKGYRVVTFTPKPDNMKIDDLSGSFTMGFDYH